MFTITNTMFSRHSFWNSLKAYLAQFYSPLLLWTDERLSRDKGSLNKEGKCKPVGVGLPLDGTPLNKKNIWDGSWASLTGHDMRDSDCVFEIIRH